MVRRRCKHCKSWLKNITKQLKNTLHPVVRFRCKGKGWCKEEQWPTREIDGCDSRFLKDHEKNKKR